MLYSAENKSDSKKLNFWITLYIYSKVYFVVNYVSENPERFSFAENSEVFNQYKKTEE